MKNAPNIEMEGDQLSQSDESTLYHHYQLNYTPPETRAGAGSPAARGLREEREMAAGDARAGSAGIGLGGILVIAGIVIAIVWSVWLGIIFAVVGLVAFGGFARGRWY